MFRSRDHVKKFVDYMNTKHPNIRFTFEVEDQNSFSFLDIKIIRNTEKKAFQTSVYRKSTFSGVFTNFKSFIPMAHKTGLLILFRCFSICSSYKKFHEKIKRNSFLPRKIHRCIKRFLNKLHVPKVIDFTAAKKDCHTLYCHTLGNNRLKFKIEYSVALKKRSSFQLEASFSVKKTTFHTFYF